MKCVRHGKAMIKDTITGLFECRGCSKLDKIVDNLHDANIWDLDLKTVEGFLNHTGNPDFKSVLYKKESSDEE